MYLTVVLYLLVVVPQINGESCKTPNNHDGDCVLLRECTFLAQKASDRTSASTQLVRESICGFSGVDSLVCCPKTQPDPPIETRESAKKNNKHLLPDSSYCGYQHSDDFFHDNITTEITEFPWLARLAYRRRYYYPSNPYIFSCLGSLINPKYILTVANCVNLTRLELIRVRLGEYHIVNDTDCVSDKLLEECSEPVRDFKIEKVIVHPEHDSKLKANDIALVRIQGRVKYSDYIRPICLPIYGRKASPVVGDILTMSGWGFINSKGDKTDIKKRVTGKVITNRDCYDSYYPKSNTTIIDSHLCTEPPLESTDLSCSGDAGGPVIAPHRIQWYQEGIVSFGSGLCGDVYPDVHTRIRSFVDWIVETIEP